MNDDDHIALAVAGLKLANKTIDERDAAIERLRREVAACEAEIATLRSELTPAELVEIATRQIAAATLINEQAAEIETLRRERDEARAQIRRLHAVHDGLPVAALEAMMKDIESYVMMVEKRDAEIERHEQCHNDQSAHIAELAAEIETLRRERDEAEAKARDYAVAFDGLEENARIAAAVEEVDTALAEAIGYETARLAYVHGLDRDVMEPDGNTPKWFVLATKARAALAAVREDG